MKRVAVIILNRNLPNVTDKLVNKVKNKSICDVFVLEACSEDNNLSKNYTWHIKNRAVKKKGLRFPQGMNLALSNLYKEKKFKSYDYFLLMTNDTEIKTKGFIKKAVNIFSNHPRLGILSPCGVDWGEKILLKKILYFWFVHNTAVFKKTIYSRYNESQKTKSFKFFI